MIRTVAIDPKCIHEVRYEIFDTPAWGIKWCNDHPSDGAYFYTIEDNNYKLTTIFAFENEHDALIFRLANGA